MSSGAQARSIHIAASVALIVVLFLLAACAFHVPPPVAGAPSVVPRVEVPGDPARPFAELDGRRWLVDTGNGTTTCDDGLVDELGLRARPVLAWARGEVGIVFLRRVVLEDVEIGGWRFRRVPCAVRDLDSTSSVPGASGILGANLLRHFAVTLDARSITLATPDPARAGVRVRREHGVGPRLVAELEVDGQVVPVVVDTGADFTYLPLTTGEVLAAYEGPRLGTGPGGRRIVKVVVHRVDAARLGAHPVPLSSYHEREGRVGLLGMDVLGQGTLVVDFVARTVSISP